MLDDVIRHVELPDRVAASTDSGPAEENERTERECDRQEPLLFLPAATILSHGMSVTQSHSRRSSADPRKAGGVVGRAVERCRGRGRDVWENPTPFTLPGNRSATGGTVTAWHTDSLNLAPFPERDGTRFAVQVPASASGSVPSASDCIRAPGRTPTIKRSSSVERR